MFFLLTIFSFSWGPIFHQTCAEEFVNEFLSNLTDTQRHYFILGNIYIDSLPRNTYHNLNNLLNLLSKSETDNIYWFNMGMLLHLTVDLFGHMGKPHSYLPLRSRPRHYFAEFVVCSSTLHDINVTKYYLTDEARKHLTSLNGRKWRIYEYLEKFIHKFGKLPWQHFLSTIEADTCKECNPSSFAMSNLKLHKTAIKNAMWDTFVAYANGVLTEKKHVELVFAEFKRIHCCY